MLNILVSSWSHNCASHFSLDPKGLGVLSWVSDHFVLP